MVSETFHVTKECQVTKNIRKLPTSGRPNQWDRGRTFFFFFNYSLFFWLSLTHLRYWWHVYVYALTVFKWWAIWCPEKGHSWGSAPCFGSFTWRINWTHAGLAGPVPDSDDPNVHRIHGKNIHRNHAPVCNQWQGLHQLFLNLVRARSTWIWTPDFIFTLKLSKIHASKPEQLHSEHHLQPMWHGDRLISQSSNTQGIAGWSGRLRTTIPENQGCFWRKVRMDPVGFYIFYSELRSSRKLQRYRLQSWI